MAGGAQATQVRTPTEVASPAPAAGAGSALERDPRDPSGQTFTYRPEPSPGQISTEEQAANGVLFAANEEAPAEQAETEPAKPSKDHSAQSDDPFDWVKDAHQHAGSNPEAMNTYLRHKFPIGKIPDSMKERYGGSSGYHYLEDEGDGTDPSHYGNFDVSGTIHVLGLNQTYETAFMRNLHTVLRQPEYAKYGLGFNDRGYLESITNFREIGAKRGKDPAVFLATNIVESGLRNDKIGADGEIGMGQVMPGTGRMVGVDNLYPLKANNLASATYLANHLDEFGNNLALSFAAYNSGAGNVHRAGNKVPNIVAGLANVPLYVEKSTACYQAICKAREMTEAQTRIRTEVIDHSTPTIAYAPTTPANAATGATPAAPDSSNGAKPQTGNQSWWQKAMGWHGFFGDKKK